MGLAASQARLLMLTARSNDLEFKSENLAQQRMDIADQVSSLLDQENGTDNSNQAQQAQQGNGINPQELMGSIGTIALMVACPELGIAEEALGAGGALLEGGEAASGIGNVLGDLLGGSSEGGGIGNMLGKLLGGGSESSGGIGDMIGNLLGGQDDSPLNSIMNFISGNNSSQGSSDSSSSKNNIQNKLAQLQEQDKKLEMQLKQVDTQHQAVQTETESVQKSIDKNIESTFKILS